MQKDLLQVDMCRIYPLFIYLLRKGCEIYIVNVSHLCRHYNNVLTIVICYNSKTSRYFEKKCFLNKYFHKINSKCLLLQYIQLSVCKVLETAYSQYEGIKTDVRFFWNGYILLTAYLINCFRCIVRHNYACKRDDGKLLLVSRPCR